MIKFKDIAETTVASNTKTSTCFLSQKSYLIKNDIKKNLKNFFTFKEKNNINAYDISKIIHSNSFSEYYKKSDKSVKAIENFIIEGTTYIKKEKNISFFDNLDIKKTKSLYKFIPLNRFIENVKNKELIFVSPSTWRDPYEKKYWQADYSALSFSKPNIYCMCLTQNRRKNEDAAWNMYTYNSDEKLIQVEYDFEKLLQVLNKQKEQIYIGNAIYDFNSREINSLYKKGGKGHFLYFNNFDETSFFNLLRIKRKSFAYENEVRIFIKNRDSNFKEDLFKIHNINYSSIVKGIRLAPYNPFGHKDCRNKIYKQIQKIERDCIEEEILKILPNINIHQSFLYTESTKRIKIEK